VYSGLFKALFFQNYYFSTKITAMSGLSEEAKLLRYIHDHAPTALSAKVNEKVVEDYLGVIHDYVDEHNEPVNSPESEQWVLEKFIALYPGFNFQEARRIMDLELEYWESGEEGTEEEEEDEEFGFEED
jgi:hypothetical protein